MQLINYLINWITQQYFLSTCPVSSTGLDDGKIKMTKLWAISLRILKTSTERLTYKELKYTRVLEMLGEKQLQLQLRHKGWHTWFYLGRKKPLRFRKTFLEHVTAECWEDIYQRRAFQAAWTMWTKLGS